MGLVVAQDGVELSPDYGQTTTKLANHPKGQGWFECIVIVNQTTIFMAGTGKSEYSWFSSRRQILRLVENFENQEIHDLLDIRTFEKQ